MAESNHSAEWLRGAVAVLDDCRADGFYKTKHDRCRALLAEAEAREAVEPTAAEVIRTLREALEGMPFSVHVRACREALALAAEWEGRNGS